MISASVLIVAVTQGPLHPVRVFVWMQCERSARCGDCSRGTVHMQIQAEVPRGFQGTPGVNVSILKDHNFHLGLRAKFHRRETFCFVQKSSSFCFFHVSANRIQPFEVVQFLQRQISPVVIPLSK